MTLVAIDLGTTNSLIAVYGEDGPVLIPNASGSVLTPSAVGVNKAGEVLVGASAKDRLVSHPKLSQARFKRYMGTEHDLPLGKNIYRAEDLSALLLGSLKADAETYLEEDVTEAIISVPAYFNDVQRKATVAAAQIAGLKVNRLVNEPTAAALAYGLQDRDGEDTFLVIDLGGGTFDVSILEMFSGVMEVRSSAGDAFLGGEDFTDAIAKHFAKQLGLDPVKMKPQARANLRAVADRAKMKLSEEHDVQVRYSDGKSDHMLEIDRPDFEEISSPLLKRLKMPIQRAIRDAKLQVEEIDRIVLVGGATRMPIVRALITRMFKTFPEHGIDPDEVVARGAAVQAGLVARHEALEDMVMTDICPFTLGSEVAIQTGTNSWEDGHFQPIIERNTVIPVSRSVVNSPVKKGQTRITLRVYQGEAPKVKDNVFLGELDIPLPKNNKEFEACDIRFTYDVSGILEVEVTVLSNQVKKRLIIEGNPGMLSEAEIQAKLKNLAKLKIHPRDERENVELMARLERLYENYLGDQRQYISHLIAQFEQVLASQDKHAVAEVREEIAGIVADIESRDVF